ncbi:MAG: fibronectin type III domain-containing protein [Blastocatellales bacterium]
MPRVYLNTGYTAPTGRTIAVTAGGDFQAALNQAQPGDVITLQAGVTFTGNFVLPNKSGSEWIVIRSSTADANLPPAGTRITPSYSAVMPKIISPNSEPAIRTASGAHHFRFIGLEIGVRSGVNIYAIVEFDGRQTSLPQVPNNLTIDRCYIHGNATGYARRGVAINSASTAIIDSYISECHEDGADSQAIAGWSGPGPFKIVNNYLEGAGENFILGGADPKIQNLIPSDIEFRRNHVAKPLKWKPGHPSYAGIKWTVKNLFELKNAQRVLVDSNVFEYNWAGGQDGTAILFTPRNQNGGSPWSVVQDVTFTNNTIRHSGSGCNISGPDDEAGTSLPSRRILIRNNLLEDINGQTWGSTSGAADGELFQIVGGAEYITIDHNTGFATGKILATDTNKGLNKALVFTNNIVAHNNYGVSGSGTGVGLPTLNRWWTSYVFQKNVIVGGQASNYPSGNYFINSFSEVGFVDMAKGDYRLSSSSPYRSAGTDGKDIGCQFGVSTNPPPPPPAPAISGVTATNITASSASIIWTTNALSNSQVEYGVTASYGSQTALNATLITSHLVTLAGLKAGTTYHYRVKSRDAAGNLGVSSDFTFITTAAPANNGPDTRAPVISAVTATVNGSSGATIKWTTDEPSDSQAYYGVTAIYGGVTPINSARVTQHSLTLTGLVSNQVYHYRVRSRDAAGNLAVSGDLTFKTGGSVVIGGGDTNGTTQGTQSVVWTKLSNLSLSGTTLTKVAGCSGCEATAVSQQSLTSGNGYLQFVAAETNRERWIGWMQGGKTVSIRNINYAFLLGGAGITSIRENGVYRAETTYKVGDVFRITIENRVVKYYKNNALIYQSRVAASSPLVAAASVLDRGGTVSNGLISTSSAGSVVVGGGGSNGTTQGTQSVVWTKLSNLSLSGTTLTKVAGCSGCEATAVSQQSLTSGNGYLQFVAAETNRERWIGWMQGGKTVSIRNINYAFLLGGAGITSIRENGVYRAETTYKVGDVFRITIENRVVKYYKNNALIYQSRVAASSPLVAAASVLDRGGTVSNGLISTSSAGSALAQMSSGAPARPSVIADQRMPTRR